MADESKASAEAPASSDASPEAASTADTTSSTATVQRENAVPSSPAETKASGSPASTEGAGATAAKRIYQAGTVRKTLLSFVFLLLLPFFASLPAMLYQRITHQLWGDILGFTIFAAAFAFIMLLVTFELIHSIRSRVEFGDSAVRLILPAARGIAMPKFFYRKQEIPYSEIDLVEMRREVYGGILAPVMLRGARVVTKAGDKVPLGYVSEANVDPMLPVPEIASEIARRAGLQVIDRGTVRREVHKKLRGIKATDDAAAAIADADIAALNRRHNNVVLAICGALFLLVSAGLMLDISGANLDLGERAHQLIQSMAKPSPQAQKQ